MGTTSEASHEYLVNLGANALNYGQGLVSRAAQLTPERIDGALSPSRCWGR